MVKYNPNDLSTPDLSQFSEEGTVIGGSPWFPRSKENVGEKLEKCVFKGFSEEPDGKGEIQKVAYFAEAQKMDGKTIYVERKCGHSVMISKMEEFGPGIVNVPISVTFLGEMISKSGNKYCNYEIQKLKRIGAPNPATTSDLPWDTAK